MKTLRPELILLLVLLTGSTLAAQEEPPPEPAWSGNLGAAYLATTGNSETSTLGLSFDLKRAPDPWGFSAEGSFQRGEDDGRATSERYYAKAQLDRKLNESWSLFASLSGEQNEFEGIDLRSLLAAGTTWHAIRDPKHSLDIHAGLTWTDENRIEGQEDVDFVGALLGLDYEWSISETSSLHETITYLPNLDESSDWRLTSVTSLTARLIDRLALELSYEIRYRNEPVGDAEDTDTSTTASLIWSF